MSTPDRTPEQPEPYTRQSPQSPLENEGWGRARRTSLLMKTGRHRPKILPNPLTPYFRRIWRPPRLHRARETVNGLFAIRSA